jgi:hypothetical protein
MLRTRIVPVAVAAGTLCGLAYIGWLLVGQGRIVPLLEASEVRRGDQEIAWLHLATESATWERFVEGMNHARAALAKASPPVALEVDDSQAFPSQTTAVPEVALRVPGTSARLWIRYYKLTSETNAAYWVRKLAERTPAPLAIVGGSTSEQARDLARELRERKAWQGEPPVLLISTATSDRVALQPGSGGVLPGYEVTEDLMGIYARRSFRFCFTNAQMADAVLKFIWSRAELKPDAGPMYMVSWRDDPYSQDLVNRFYEVFYPPEGVTRPALEAPGPASRPKIPYSMGGYNEPNAHEAERAEELLDRAAETPQQQRTLLVLPAATQPARRFLRAMVQAAPTEAGKFVVATGDYIDFNTICRDRNFAWPILDLPFRLVFFSHRNPVDQSAGFKTSADMTSSSTNDVLLYSDVVQTLVRVAFAGNRLQESAAQLCSKLRELEEEDGELRFAENGDLRGGSGEYVVVLLPQRSEHGRVLPWALAQVHVRAESRGGWQLVQELKLTYAGRTLTSSPPEGGRSTVGRAAP